MPDTSHIPLPLLILIRGLPGSGKSYLSNVLQDVFAEYVGRDNVIPLDPDAIDFNSTAYYEHTATLTNEGVDEKLYPYRFLRGKAYDGIKNRQIIIWNQAFTNLEIFNKMNENMRLQAIDAKVDLKILVIEVSITPELAMQRIKDREQNGGHDVPEDVFARFVRDYRSYADEGYATVKVDGNTPTQDSVTSILQTIESL